MNLKISVLFAWLLFGFISLVSAQEEIINKMKTAFKTNNAKSLIENFSNNVEMSFEGDRAQYNKSQAESKLAEFFKKHPCKDFVVKHQGASREEGSKFLIVNYTSTNGGEFRVNILFKNNKGNYFIETVDFN